MPDNFVDWWESILMKLGLSNLSVSHIWKDEAEGLWQ